MGVALATHKRWEFYSGLTCLIQWVKWVIQPWPGFNPDLHVQKISQIHFEIVVTLSIGTGPSYSYVSIVS